MALGNVVYTAEQRDAMGEAVVDRGVKPAQVVEYAAAGQLEHVGERLAPFACNENTVRDRARKLRARRAGKIRGELAKQAPRDAVDTLRVRLLNMIEQEMTAEERKPRGKRSLERIRQLTRALREAAALPGPDDPRPVAPGQKIPGVKATAGGATRGGLAAGILAAAGRVETQPAQNASPPNGDGVDASATGTGAEQPEHDGIDGPGAWARAQMAAQQGAEAGPAELHTSST